MKKHLLMKTLLVALVCLVGQSAWATDVPYTVGTPGTGDVWGERKYSDAYEIAPGEIYHFTFTNTSYGSENWNNWLLDCKASADTSVDDWYFTMRSDNYGWGTNYNSAMRNVDFVWGNFQTVMNGATVDMYVDYSSTDKIIRTYTTITKSETIWHYNFASKAIVQPSVFLLLSEEYANLNITTAEKVASLPNGAYTLYKRSTTDTDCGAKWKDDDKDNIWVPSATNANFTYAIDGGLSLANTSPSANFKSSYSASRVLTPNAGSTVSMTAVATMGVASGRNTSYDYITIGGVSLQVNGQNQKAQVYVDGVAQGTEVSATRGASYTFNVEINQTTGDVTYSVSGGASIAEAAASTSTAISNVVVGHHRGGGENYNTNIKLTNIDITEQISAVSYANYTVHFQDNNGATVKSDEVRVGEVGTIVNASSGDMADYYGGGNKYTYKNDGGGVEVVAGGTAELTVVYDKHEGFTATASAVCGGSPLQADIASVSGYEGETKPLQLHKYIKVGETWYSTATCYVDVTAAGDNEVTYTATAAKYFYEFESLSGGRTDETDKSYSGGVRSRVNKSNALSTPEEIAGGVYTLTIPYSNGNSTAGKLYLYTVKGGVETDTGLTIDCPSGNGTVTKTVTIPDGAALRFKNTDDTYNDNGRIDYLVLTPKVPVEVTAAGFATYVNSDYDLDFSATEIEAYKVKVTAKGVATLTKVNNVPAGTPVLLYKDGGKTEDIPVMTGAAAVSDNDLVAGTGAAVATTVGEYTNMILNNVSGIGFYFANGQTVATNRAYLHFAKTLAPDPAAARMTMIFEDDDVTSISEELRVKSEEFAPAADFYDLQGRKVAQPTKGLYIVNGKKVVLK